jgi:IMP dehydrogenase
MINHRIQTYPVTQTKSRASLISLDGLTFDDVLILPNRTDVRPDQIDLSAEVLVGHTARLPIMSAPMTSVWSKKMSTALALSGGIGAISRDLTIAELFITLNEIAVDWASSEQKTKAPIVVACSPFDCAKIEFLLENPLVDYIMLDSVQPYSGAVIEIVKKYSNPSRPQLIIGNIATADAAETFCQFPIAGLKVGLGPGSICTTRVISGVGVPQLEAIQQVSNVAKHFRVPVIADGGIKSSGDIAKALAAGASSVMMGRIFAGALESPGMIEQIGDKKYKHYAGSLYASIEGQDKTGNQELDAWLGHLESTQHRVEGVSGFVPYIGPAQALLTQIRKSLQASFAFTGSSNIAEFHKKARFIPISHSGVMEGRAHSIAIVPHSTRTF